LVLPSHLLASAAIAFPHHGRAVKPFFLVVQSLLQPIPAANLAPAAAAAPRALAVPDLLPPRSCMACSLLLELARGWWFYGGFFGGCFVFVLFFKNMNSWKFVLGYNRIFAS